MRFHPWRSLQSLSLIYALLVTVSTPAAELPFPVVTVQSHRLAQEQVLDGVVEAVNRSTVSAQISGRVQEILVDVNDSVAQGAVIVRLRDTEQRARLEQMQALLKEAQARFEETQAEYRRVRDLYDKKLVAQANMDSAAASQDAARARLEAARASVAQAQEDLDNTVIRAPYAGIVLERHVHLGESVQPGSPLMSGFSLDLLRVVATVPQRLIEKVRQHSRARVLWPDGGSIAGDRLTFFPYADPASNVFKVRVALPQKTVGLYPGMFVKVAFTVGETERLLAPRQALVQRGEVTAVYVVAAGQVSLRQVRVGGSPLDDRVEVLAGLVDGEQVALDPVAAGVYLKTQPAGR